MSAEECVGLTARIRAVGLEPDLQHSLGVGPQDLEQQGLALQVLQGRGDHGVLAVAADVDEEDIVPDPAPGGARLDAGHADAVGGERGQQGVQPAGLVATGEQQAGLVAPGGGRVLVADHQEAGGVALLVLDALGQDRHPVDLGGRLAGDGRRPGLSRRQARGLGVAGHGDALGLGQVAVEPAAALGQGLLVGVDGLDGRQVRRLAHQVMMDAQADLADDAQGRGHEQVQGVADDPLGAVLHRDHPVVAGPGLHLAEDVADGGHGYRLHRVTEVLARRRLGEGPLRPQEGGPDRALQGQAGGHDLAEEPGDLLAAQGAGVAFLDPPQDLRLAFGPIELYGPVRGLDLRHPPGALGALADEAQQVRIDGVDALADGLQGLIVAHRGAPCRSGFSPTGRV